MGSSTFDYLSSSALSLTVSGNTGISPFLTLLVLGIVEISNPTLLNMGETMETILASWYSIAIFGILALIEMVGKCIPVVDELIDSIEVFIVPILSVLGSLGTLGVLDLIPLGNDSEVVEQQNNATAIDVVPDDRQLINDGSGETFLTVWKVFLVLSGVGLSLTVHFFKMLIRLSGIVCCAGCCQPCITIMEMTLVCCGVVFAIFIKEIAIFFCVVFLLIAAYTIRVKCCKNGGKNDDEEGKSRDEQNSITSPKSSGGPKEVPEIDEDSNIDLKPTNITNATTGKIETSSSREKNHDEENPSPSNTASATEDWKFIPSIVPPPPINPNFDENDVSGETNTNNDPPLAKAVLVDDEEKKDDEDNQKEKEGYECRCY